MGHSEECSQVDHHVVIQGVREPREDLGRAPAGGRIGRGQAHPLREGGRVSHTRITNYLRHLELYHKLHNKTL